MSSTARHPPLMLEAVALRPPGLGAPVAPFRDAWTIIVSIAAGAMGLATPLARLGRVHRAWSLAPAAARLAADTSLRMVRLWRPARGALRLGLALLMGSLGCPGSSVVIGGIVPVALLFAPAALASQGRAAPVLIGVRAS